ncbi:MAG TPA: mitofilin family membrane protein, partial [Pseudorhizobium sp.]|nr:mitofilin family membrane protein [Pseudorhizobium sp.]
FGGIVALALAGSMQYAGYLPSGGTDTSTAGEIAALRQEVEALQQAPAPAPDQDLQARIQALEATAAAGGDDGSSERLSAMEQEVQALRSAVEAASQESNSRLDRFRQQLEALEARVNEPGPEQAAARAITAAALKAAADEGRAFESELEAFAATAPDDPAVAQLQPYVQEGVPTPAQLSDRFSEASPNILETVNQPAADQSVAQRLMSSALSVVKVRRTGETDGTAPEAIVSRIEGALRSSDLKGAASAWEALPEQAKAVSGDFKQALDARLAVDGLIADMVSRAVSETTNQNQGPTE